MRSEVAVMSLTLAFTGNSSTLESHFFPPIHLDDSDGGNWTCGLLNFEAYNSIPNLDETNNRLHLGEGYITLKDDEIKDLMYLLDVIRKHFQGTATIRGSMRVDGKVTITCSKTIYNHDENNILRDLGFDENRKILEANVEHVSDNVISHKITKRKFYVGTTYRLPTGSYEIADIAKLLEKYGITLIPNRNELKCTIKTGELSVYLDSKFGSIGSLLGFTNFTLVPHHAEVVSDSIVDIFKVNAIGIECSIISGSWKNGQPSHVIHQFFPNVPPGFKIIEAPQNVVYLDLLTNTLDNITLRIVDQEGKLVDFRGETITVRLHLKRSRHD